MLLSSATLALLTTTAFAASSDCKDYLLVSTRGTGELQGVYGVWYVHVAALLIKE